MGAAEAPIFHRSEVMLKVLMIPAVLGVAALAFADKSLAASGASPSLLKAGSAEVGCGEATDPWLPGALQIGDRSAAAEDGAVEGGAANETEAELRIKRGPDPSDCALV